ncbi:hypothetical protein ACFFLZ_00015 [Photobacterium aphoticum]|uniref:Uncharacterized protein n=1 Tax=Photobacterium aphoticum TaxID=754436 RepID=A0A0J1GFZ3_9GAMM|nr:hypothetical protein [Photobacterium aphoticum]KLU98490.1 hypothetical protein ABT58_22660 [Photobacterium aphoticum]PSU57437.1 hypothetical protein C9I90_09910 [Photobacterium aphoticum]GHA63373.1 hypothetical protein GCM10007086_41480 [Photobacterium aphoticum]
MPIFKKIGNRYIGAYQCGAGQDAYLEVELVANHVPVPELYAKSPMAFSLSEGVDPEAIREAALLGAKMANDKLGTTFGLKRIGYIPNDSTRYSIHARVVSMIISRVHVLESNEKK